MGKIREYCVLMIHVRGARGGGGGKGYFVFGLALVIMNFH